jgi:AmpD protein
MRDLMPASRFVFAFLLTVFSALAFAQAADLRVSCHLLVRRDGSITQFVPFTERAWHAGRSSWRGRADCNDYSVGIELEGCDDAPYAEAQYTALATALDALRAAYPRIAPDSVVGHRDVAPGRKSDPGPAFDWARLAAARTR